MIKTIRYLWRLVIAFTQRRKFLILLGFSFGVFVYFVLPKFLELFPQRPSVKTIGLVGRFTLENFPEEIQQKISLGLTQLSQDETPRPGLAKEWIVGGGGKVYTFKLKDNLFWHDGKEIKAKDINYNFKDVEIKVLETKTIQFILKEPFSPFPVIVSRPVFKKGLLGAGTYKVKKITRQGQFVEQIFLSSLEGKNPHLMYRFYPTEEAAKTALKLGEVKILANLVDRSGFEDWRNLKITPQPSLNHQVAVFFNTSKENLQDKKLRQALAYAIPKEVKNRALSPLSPLSWAYNSDVKPYEENLEKAKSLLKKSLEEQKEKEITLKLTTTPSLISQGEKITRSWEALGVKAELEVRLSVPQDFEAFLAIQEIPKDPDQYSFWHSTQKTSNITNFKNPRIDKLLEDGRKTLDQQERKKIYFDFQRFLVEEVPAIFLYHPTFYQISRE